MPWNHRKAEFPADFKFDLLGVRVPTVIVSPWTNSGVVDSGTYDHSSILKTVEERFGYQSLTARDRQAKSFSHLFARTTLNRDTPERLGRAETATATEDAERSGDESLSVGNLAGFLRIAISIEHLLNEREASLLRRSLHSFLGKALPFVAITRTPEITNRDQAREYIARVAERVDRASGTPLVR